MFIPIDKTSILKIPLCNLEVEDFLSWKARKYGHYSIKTGCYNIMDWQRNMKCESSNREIKKDIWGRVWGSKVTPRKQYPPWRLLTNILHLKENLRNKGIQRDLLCPKCSSRMQSTYHCVRTCWWANYVWFGSQLNLNYHNNLTLEFTYHCKNNIPQVSTNNLATFIKLINGIWNARNKRF